MKRAKRLTRKQRQAAALARRCDKWMWHRESAADYRCVRDIGHKGGCSIASVKSWPG